jgi:signal transduction histidine kinase
VYSGWASDPVANAEDPRASEHAATIAALQDEVARLRIAVQARNDFISIAAHELRNPMTPLLLIVQAMRRMADRDPETPVQLAAGLVRLDRIVLHYIERCSALLDISRLSADTFRAEYAEFDLAAVVRATVEDMTPIAEQAGSVVTVVAPDALHGEWDELALRHVVENLLSNAIKYGAGKPIALRLSSEHGTTLLEVCDHGLGISPADQAHISVPFESAVTRRREAGFGLGLWVIGRLVAALNGTIQVASSSGRGSTFSVRLPQYRTTRLA